MQEDLLCRLTYASTATFEPNASGGIEVAVGQILTQSRRNNKKRKIGGVLHYGNGYFLQCLEGSQDDLESLFTKISGDKRHKDVRRLSRYIVEKRMFPEWSMKYLPVEDEIRKVLERHNVEFNPYQLEESIIEEVLQACAKGVDPMTHSQAQHQQERITLTDKGSIWKRLLVKAKKR